MLTRTKVEIQRLGEWWCRARHQAVRWPMHGEYQCAICYRRYAVAWAESEGQRSSARTQRASGDHHSVTTWAPSRHDSRPGLPVF